MKKVLLFLCMMMFFACGEKEKETSAGSSEKDKQELTVFLRSEPKNLDLSRSTDSYSSEIFALTNEGLVAGAMNGKGEEIVVPSGAESWTTSPDGLTWTFKLRPDAVWADGKKVTAEEYVYGILRTLDPKVGSSYAFLLYPIKNSEKYNSGKGTPEEVGVKALDESTVEIQLEHPTPYFIQLAYFKVMYPQRKDMVEKYGDAYGSEGAHIMSNGPYLMKEWVHNNKVVVVKNPKYWDAKNHKLDQINMLIVMDENSRMNLLSNGQVDIGVANKPEWVKQFTDSGKFYNQKRYELATNYAYFNQNSKYFKNVKIRQAFSLALDRESINKVMFEGYNDPAYGFVSKGIQIGDKEYRSLVPGQLKGLMEKYPDPKVLLSEGLQELGMDPDPSKMTITYLSSGTDSWARKYAEFIQQMLKTKLGIEVNAEFVEWPVFQKRTDELDYEMAAMAWSGDYNDPNTFLDLWISSSKMVPTGWANAKYDELIKKAGETDDQSKRLEYFKEAEDILVAQETVVAPVLYRVKNSYIRNYVKDYNPTVIAPYNYKNVSIEGRK